jgi:hypothetical protein
MYIRVSRWHVYFQTKNSNLVKFCRALEWKMSVYFMVIWYIFCPFGYVVPIWYFSPFWFIVSRKIWQPWYTYVQERTFVFSGPNWIMQNCLEQIETVKHKFLRCSKPITDKSWRAFWLFPTVDFCGQLKNPFFVFETVWPDGFVKNKIAQKIRKWPKTLPKCIFLYLLHKAHIPIRMYLC